MPKTTTTQLSVGERVKVKYGKQHDGMTAGKTGTIVQISTPAIGIRFDGMNTVHKWYADDELERA